MFGKTKKTASKIASLVLSVALFIPTMYGMTVNDFVRADDDFEKTISNTRLGVDEMDDPMVLYAGVDTWRGSFVYFGKYNGQPIRFRVLDKASTKYTTDGSKTMFLDSDKVLYEEYFNNTLLPTDPNANKWSESNLKASLNGSGFLNKDGVFTQAEKGAIAESYVAGYALTGINQEAIDTFGTSVGLNGEKVFALDITDILNHDYGYYDMRDYDSVDHGNYDKQAAADSGIQNMAWWLRNEGVAPTDSGIKTAGEAMYYSYTTWQVNDTKAVAPALNIDHDSILFSTATSGVYGSLDVEYKLTLLDPEMIVSVTEGSVRKDWNRISFETTHSGKNITNISRSSYLITSGTIGSANNSILDYGEVHGGNGSAYFVLPSSLSGTWGQDYHVYVFAEDLNGKYESDYASAPVELANPETSGSFSGKTLNNTKLGVDDIHDPAIPANTSTAWNGSIVYFGKYEGNPIRFRVLDKASTAFGDDTTLFLDSEGALFSHQFSDNGSNQWVGSDIRAALNGNAFLDKSGVFTVQEKDAIYSSNTSTHPLTGRQDVITMCGNAVGLENDRIFLLDVEDLLNENYGYIFDDSPIYSGHSNAAKWAYFKDEMAVWALRNAEAGTDTTSAFVTRIGQLGTIGISYMSPRDIAPALNVDHDSILFSTAIKGTYGELGTAYKLTLLDPEMIVSVPEGSVSMEGNQVNFGYGLSGQNFALRSQISYIVTSKTLGSDGNSILDYGAIHGGNYQGYFTLPNTISGTWGEDYHIYIFAEKFNGTYESDYAGPLVELVKPESSVPVVFEGKTASNTKIGVDDISDPRTPTSPDDAWNGSYVYFGKYSDTSVKYRVLDKDSTLFSDKTTVFLDCDSTLFDADFDSFVNANDPGSNVWINSDIRTALNGDAFLEKSGTFTAMEKSAIVASTVAGHPLTSVNADAVSEFVNYIGLENDKIFLLDAEDVLNPEYGYYDALANGPYGSSAPYHPAYNWYKCELQSPSDFHLWWLRSQDHELDSQHADYFAGVIFYGVGGTQVNEAQGVAPAMNIDSESILFSTAIKGTYGELGTAYKLTLLDPEMIVSVPEGSVSIEGNKVNFGYGLSGQNFALRSQISYIVTSKPFGSDDNSILDYGATAGGNYKGYLTLSDSVSGTWGEDYYIYIFAEKFNGTYESDYAGPLVELVKPESSVPVIFEGKTVSNTKLGVDEIHDPATHNGEVEGWQGSIVYFGQYDGRPNRFRVLDKDSTAFGDDTTLFLDSELVLFRRSFSSNGSNAWVGSDIRDALNGDEFLDKDGVFTRQEKKAIYYSNTQTHSLTGFDQRVSDWFGNAVGLQNDQIFLLDIEDLLNEQYGYVSDNSFMYECRSNAAKWAAYDDGWTSWWLRSAEKDSNTLAAYVVDNYVSTIGISNMYQEGVAPALNVDRDSILFSSAVKGTYGELDTEYKLTLKDSELKMSVKAAEKDGYGTRTKVSYQLSGGSVTDDTKVSYLFTSKPIGEAGNSILAYGSLVDANGSSGYIPAMKGITGTWGQNYHVYVFAENVNGTYETDYAGTPVEISDRRDPAPVFSGKDTQNTRLGTGKMSSPAVPLTPKDAWDGSYVYFGKYEGEPVMYRVLDPDTDIFGSKTLFLDCDTGLYWDYFDEDNETNTWNDSDIRANLNGDLFLNKDGVFTYAEKASIAESVIDSHPLTGILQSAINLYGNYVGLDGDKVFVLDAEDTYNGQYGYINGYNDVGGWSNCWKTCDGGNPYVACWLRNAAGIRPLESSVIWCAGIIPQDPRMEVYADYAVSPALNVSQDSIIFSTAVEGYYGELGSAYKLTIKDPDINLNVSSLSVSGNTVSFSYSVQGDHKNEVTQISYLVVKKGTGYPKIDTIAAYGAVTLSGNHGGEFELPANLTGAFGTDYNVYVLAEDINGTYETDYAGMTELIIPTVVFDFTNGPVTCDEDQMLALSYLFFEGYIDTEDDIEDSDVPNNIDVDKDGTWDFTLENSVLTKTSTCSIEARKVLTGLENYASITFIVGASPKIARHAIRLTGSIGVKFGVDFPDGTDVSKCYVQFETSTGRSSVVRTPVRENSRISYIFNITCLELADEITATLYYDGEAVQTDTFSAMSYITYVQDHPRQFEDRVVDLVNALQSYGYYMQRSDWSDNIRHTGIPKPSRILTSFDVDNATFDLNNTTLCGVQKDLGTSGISSGMKISLTLTSATELKLYVKPENSSVVMPSNAKAVDFNGVTYYEFSVKNIGPHLLDKTRSFEITTNLGTATVSLPATFYVKNMLNKSTTTEAQKVALTAYYQYYKAAKACVD
ncbi:MAG: hypothetical protein J5653_03710 [Clostridiales bacterium]|nr:hypothetical protein [Clostridiales bacterium]